MFIAFVLAFPRLNRWRLNDVPVTLRNRPASSALTTDPGRLTIAEFRQPFRQALLVRLSMACCKHESRFLVTMVSVMKPSVTAAAG